MTTDIPAPDVSGRPRRFHVVGIGGAGMSAIATALVGLGHRVTGSDLKDSSVVDRVRALGIDVSIGHDASNLGDADAVALSTAIPRSNPELVEAERRGLEILTRAQVLAAICGTRRTIAVAGSHGKTTTSSMLALILRHAGWSPSFIIGGDLNEVGSGAVWDDGEWLVVEADESDGTFLHLPRQAAVLTSVEPDHLEHWGGETQLIEGFRSFLREVIGPKVACADDRGAAALAGEVGATTYGQRAGSDYLIGHVELAAASAAFQVTPPGAEPFSVSLPVPGLHNVLNAAGALALALELGVDRADAVAALARFGGVARRMEFRGERDGITYIDDYAHLPGEVECAIAAARAGQWGRVVVVFQPHRFSRTASLAPSFARSFDEADVVVITDIYSAGEAPRPGITGKLVVDAVAAGAGGPSRASLRGGGPEPLARRGGRQPKVVWLPSHGDLVDWLRANLRSGDLCLTLGAGDLTTLPSQLL
ncbi:MAG TPA: UDP-N-acetylmuramate--L-alanine ligase [Acidimicrobiales bacterium]|nr:UDP-N-acetylmuramate--L-alanine ligase [Acidimicrobiales bacterium]